MINNEFYLFINTANYETPFLYEPTSRQFQKNKYFYNQINLTVWFI